MRMESVWVHIFGIFRTYRLASGEVVKLYCLDVSSVDLVERLA
jgi:hypothetical protein